MFLNDEIVEAAAAGTLISDRGFLYGDGLFETLRSYNGYLFNFDKHIARMRSSAAYLKIPFNYTAEEIKAIINDLVKRNGLPDAYIRITLSRGVGIPDFSFRISGVKSQSGKICPTFVIQAKPLKAYPPHLYEKGVSLIVSNIKISVSCPISRHKTSNYLTNILARDEANLKGAEESVLLNTDDFVAECAVSNIFIVENGRVVTPRIEDNILPGITRETVLGLCRTMRVPAEEESFGVDGLMEAGECFITNSLMEIMPVRKIEGKNIGAKTPGEITARLINAYKDLVKTEL